jgi:hypothetical protein
MVSESDIRRVERQRIEGPALIGSVSAPFGVRQLDAALDSLRRGRTTGALERRPVRA